MHDSKTRRWLGAVFLLLAIAMLVADEYLLKGRLTGLAFLAYWLVCFGFTLLAIMAAYFDFRALRRSTRDEQRALFARLRYQARPSDQRHRISDKSFLPQRRDGP